MCRSSATAIDQKWTSVSFDSCWSCLNNVSLSKRFSGHLVQCDQCQMFQHCQCVKVNSKNPPDTYHCPQCLMPGERLREAARKLRKLADDNDADESDGEDDGSSSDGERVIVRSRRSSTSSSASSSSSKKARR